MSAHKPRSGSLAYYPRVRSARHFANFRTYPETGLKEVRPLNFFGYKAGMLTLFGRNAHDKSHTFGQETAIPSTIIECPPMKVIGVRAYRKDVFGLHAISEVTVDKPEKDLRRKIKAFKEKGKARQEAGKGKDKGNAKEEESTPVTFEMLEKSAQKIADVVLLVQTQPSMTGIGKKKADVGEVHLSGDAVQKLVYAKEKFGKDLRVSEALVAGNFADVKAVDKGKGFQGVVKRFGVKIHRPKAKKRRYVGSIGPWYPPVVMWTVARAGQMGYQNRTEYNKRILVVESQQNASVANPSAGFQNYGIVKNDFVALHGSVPGAAKRPVAIRVPTRLQDANKAKFTDLKFPSQTAPADEGRANKGKAEAKAGKKQ
ncbi:50S ribosomal protein L3 [uncultured archaeon]|nr:50S ribosomal protein L3 [uncultured archaeon]